MSNLPRNAPFVSLLITSVTGVLLGQTRDPVSLLKEADHLADLYNWADAGPMFEEAQQVFSATGQMRNALYSKIGHRGAVPSADSSD